MLDQPLQDESHAGVEDLFGVDVRDVATGKIRPFEVKLGLEVGVEPPVDGQTISRGHLITGGQSHC